MTRIAFDTNILLYGEGLHDARRAAISRDLLARLPDVADLVLPVQVLGEFVAVMRRKFQRPQSDIADALALLEAAFELVPTDFAVWQGAKDLVQRHSFQIWDAIILSAAQVANCEVLLSEDMQDGFLWRGTRLINPFSATASTTLETYLKPAPSRAL